MTDFSNDIPGGAVAHAGEYGRSEQQFAMGSAPELRVDGGSGNVTVRAEDTSTIRVRGLGEASRAARGIRAFHDGNRLRLHLRGSDDYEIVTPRDCRLNVHLSSGDLTVEGHRAPATLETSSGDIWIENVTGTCSVSTSSGDVSGRRITGGLRVQASSGDVEIRESQLRGFYLHNSSGELTIETPLTPGERYVADTSSGDLHLLVPANARATVHLRTGSGSVDCGLPAEILRSSRREWIARLNGGGATVEMRSSSGSLHIASGWSPGIEDAPSSALQEQPPVDEPILDEKNVSSSAPVDDETTVILGLLERGELSVEDAMARLDALE